MPNVSLDKFCDQIFLFPKTFPNLDWSLQGRLSQTSLGTHKQNHFIPVFLTTDLEGRMSSLAFLLPFSSVKYQILKSGNPLEVYHQVIQKVESKYRVRFVEAPGDHKVSILFCPVISRIGSDAETAIATIKGK